ncbi:tyrosine-protein kinase Etk/Wzc [Sulfitobacter litoralis]|uniref:Tyrosine-protein kinase Etk/Wzc n=1 Tax=Sulfitobacter litoralis TaxID=335975 RepID=A0ABY0SUD4_9RHOB|nr:polysaccharide biosynthesis tyrosine autokinase [Sulfitobacter litoralis]SDP61735.1 tyrosine-protein kinase Etk/Wzc [Sulfitobacter litoralis]
MTERSQKKMPEIDGNDGDLDLSHLLAQFLARKWLIIALAFLGGTIGLIIGQLGPNNFRAISVVQIETRSSGVVLPEELIGNLLSGDQARGSSFETEIHVIRSRLILGPVVEKLGVNARVEPIRAPIIGDLLARRSIPLLGPLLPDAYQRPGESISLNQLRVSEDLIGAPISLRVTGFDSFEITAPNSTTVTGRVGTLVTLGDDIQLQVTALNAAEGREYHVFAVPFRHSVARLRNGLSVNERRSTGIVDFSFTSANPDFSVVAANTVVESYRLQNLQRRSAEIDQSIDFIESKIPEVRLEAAVASTELATYRETQANLELSLGTQELLDQLVQVQTRLEELAFQEQQLAQRLTPNHPDYQALLAERTRLQSRGDSLRADLQDVPAAEQEFARLQERVVSARELERQLVARAEQLRVLRASAVGNIRVLEPAEVARLIGPNRRTPALTGLFGGLAFSILLVFGLNFLRRGIEDAREVEELGLSVLGSVNKVPKLAGAKKGIPEYALVRHEPSNIAVEAFRGLRTGMRFTLAARNAKTIMITSCAPADGKSFVSLNLAMINATLGTRVLLIDGDMRRGKLGRNFGVASKQAGLAQVLVGEADLLAATHTDPTTGLDFIGTGSRPPNPAELLESTSFSDLLSVLSEKYDLIIVDAPPILAVTDAAIIGQKTDITLMLVRHLVTTKPQMQSALKGLELAGITPAGAIINQYDMNKSRYGQYSTSYGYHYGAYKYNYSTEE